MDLKEQVSEILKRLRKEYPDPKTALTFGSPFELLVATILSAQATDVHVNKVTEKLFKKYKSIKDYSNADPDMLRKDVSSINFYRNKAKNIQASAKMIIERFNSKVPNTMDELTTLLGLTKNEDPVKIEKELMAVTPQKEWSNISHLLIFHGRKVCQAKKPMHKECVLYDICPSRNI